MPGERETGLYSSSALRELAEMMSEDVVALVATADEMDSRKIAEIDLRNVKAVKRLTRELTTVSNAAKAGFRQAKLRAGLGDTGTAGTESPKKEPTNKDLRKKKRHRGTASSG
ncbi:MAG: hypothetical protein ABFC63_05655 [Thermoguttaceae bacterium]